MKVTVGQRLIVLKERTGMSLAEIASKAGYAGASSIQKLFRSSYDPSRLQRSAADRLKRAFVGMGDPSITAGEIDVLAGEGNELDALVAELAHYSHASSAFVGVHQTKRINDFVETEDGVQIPLFVRQDTVEGIPYFPCPDYLRSKRLVGIYVTVGNMWPRFEEGETVIYEHRTPPTRGDDVIVRIVSDIELDGGYLLGRLHLLHDDEVQVDQLSPRGRVVLPRKSVIAVHRIVHATDLLPPVKYARVG